MRTAILPGTPFCTGCGSKVNTYCTNCGARLLEGASFCAGCGRPTDPGEMPRPKQRGEQTPLGEQPPASLAPPAPTQEGVPETREPRSGRGKPSRRARFIDGSDRLVRARIRESVIHVGDLPRGVRVLALLGYAGVLLLLVATPLFEWLGSQMPPGACEQGSSALWLCFSGFGGNNVLWGASVPALLTFILAYVVGWALVLTGASDCRPLVFVPIAALFVSQLFLLPGGLSNDVVLRAWGVSLALAAVPVGMYLFSHRLLYWRDLPLLEFVAWLLVIVGFAGSLLLIGGIGVAGWTVLNILYNSRTVLETLSFLLALQTADVAVSLSGLTVTRLRRSLTEEGFGRLVMAVLLARPVIPMAMLFLTANDFWLTDYMVSLLLIGFALRLGAGGRPLAGKTGILLLALLSLSALAFLVVVPGGSWPWRFYFLLVPLVLATVWLVLERRWTTRTAATLLALSLAWPVVVLGLVLAFSGRGDFIEAPISATGLVPPVLLFVGLNAYGLLGTGAGFANTEGRVVPRSGRVLLYFGALISVTGLFIFFATLRDSATGQLDQSLQAGLGVWFAFGTFFMAAPYLAWTAWRHRERLVGGEEEPSLVRWQPSGWWVVIGVLFGLLATRLLVWEFRSSPILGTVAAVGIGIIIGIASRASGVRRADTIAGVVGLIAGVIIFLLMDLPGRI